uniref:MACPF domain-containing protein n=1 Tax=Meloidogyne hapla TaxID=6305 RepID=A0A1I8BDH1_MELHA
MAQTLGNHGQHVFGLVYRRGGSNLSVAEKKTLDYTLDFPKLLNAPSATSTSSSATSGAWIGSVQPAIKSVVTEAFKLSAEERALLMVELDAFLGF